MELSTLAKMTGKQLDAVGSTFEQLNLFHIGKEMVRQMGSAPLGVKRDIVNMADGTHFLGREIAGLVKIQEAEELRE